MGGQSSKRKLVPNRPPPKVPVSGPAPSRMVPKPPRKRMVPPDGGWGWMVVLGACISLLFFPALTVSFGVIFSERLAQLGARATQFTIIANGLVVVYTFTALMVPPLTELFGYRSITFTGGLLAFLTLLLCAYSTSVVSFAVAYSLVGGVAMAFANFTGLIIIPQYFTSRKGLANSCLSTFSALGKIVMAPLLHLLLEEYGYRWACLLSGALSLHTCVTGMLFHPPAWHKILDPDDANEMRVEAAGAGGGGGSQVVTGRQQQQEQHTSTNSTPRPGRIQRDEEDEDVIFVMPTNSITTQPPPTQRHDDEVVLFSRGSGPPSAGHQQGSELSKEEKMKMIKADSMASMTGSLFYLAPPLDYKVYDDDEDPRQQSCFKNCFLIKPFLLLDYGLLWEPNFHLIAWPASLLTAGFYNLVYALPGYITSLGFSHLQGAFAISVFCISEVVVRLPIGLVSDYSWFPTELGYVAGFVLTALSAGCMTLVASYEWILVWLVVLGLGLSLVSALGIHVILKYLGVERYAQANGFITLNYGLCVAVFGFITGLIREYTNSYYVTFSFVTALMGAAAGMWVCRLCFHYSTQYKKVPAHTP